MSRLVILALRVVIILTLAGTLFVQVWMVPVIWRDLEGTPDLLRGALAVVLVLGVLTLQVSAVCVWQLLTMVRRGSVFSDAAFRYVDIIIGAIAAGSILTFVLAVMLAPGDAAPGIVGLICGASLIIAGVALIVFILKLLLKQAVAREAEAAHLRSELNEVI
ncbi:DUF2975 domain-containing protein [Microbacterium sp.]|uniref:DUF2975 domain-containing protein n=1 Tax=Microbacterium sp. TaxID=51671 RepID=UPI002E2FDFCE|nr:DUF2975 domain-containing protein [Microbacterium sp.]HEX5729458.1 DUF2975 domain-containing protein [Microbacterium sp.]